MIKNITYHILNKEQGSTESASIELNPELLDVSDDSSNELLDQLSERYKGRAGKGYGVFEDDTDSYPASLILSDYLDKNNDTDFLNATERFMNVLKSLSQSQVGAKGGKVAFIHYEDDGIDYFLCAILSEKVGLMAKNWELTQDEILNIDNMRFAGRINLTEWQDENSTNRYISFLKGQGEVSEYFKHFMGCNVVLMATQETKVLVEAINRFATEQDLNIMERTRLKSDAKEYLDELAGLEGVNGQFSMQSFANRVWPDEPQVIIDCLQQNEVPISDGFVPDKRSLRSLIVHVHRTKHWSFSFDDEAYRNGDVTIVDGKVIFNEPPEDIIRAYSGNTEE